MGSTHTGVRSQRGEQVPIWSSGRGHKAGRPQQHRGGPELELVRVPAEVGSREEIQEAELIGAVSAFSRSVPYAFPTGLTSLGLNSMSGLRIGEFLSSLPQLGSHG